MQKLDLGQNHHLSGNISEFDSLLWIQDLWADGNAFTGPVPAAAMHRANVRALLPASSVSKLQFSPLSIVSLVYMTVLARNSCVAFCLAARITAGISQSQILQVQALELRLMQAEAVVTVCISKVICPWP